jgi:hypothetical protein
VVLPWSCVYAKSDKSIFASRKVGAVGMISKAKHMHATHCTCCTASVLAGGVLRGAVRHPRGGHACVVVAWSCVYVKSEKSIFASGKVV